MVVIIESNKNGERTSFEILEQIAGEDTSISMCRVDDLMMEPTVVLSRMLGSRQLEVDVIPSPYNSDILAEVLLFTSYHSRTDLHAPPVQFYCPF
jgi:hypothetical protein